jgi:hypothetical protein
MGSILAQRSSLFHFWPCSDLRSRLYLRRRRIPLLPADKFSAEMARVSGADTMKRIIADISQLPNGWLSPVFYCIDAEGQLDRAVTHTLLLLIQQAHPHEAELESLVTVAESGRYASPNLKLPDWGVNDINLWLLAPMAQPGHVCISNENAGDYSADDGGQPQQFTFEQFRSALKHWREFKELIAKEGKDNLVGRRFEAPWR